MSLYVLQKLLYELNRDLRVQEEFLADRDAVLAHRIRQVQCRGFFRTVVR